MRKCIICRKRRVIRRWHYFCPVCYNKYKGEEWFREYQNILKRQERSDNRFYHGTLGFDDLIWIDGRKIETPDGDVWIDGRIVKVEEILDEKAEQEYLIR